jgi:hypothetical protein
MTLLTPQQIFEKRPSIHNFFSYQQIGYLFFCGVVRGRKLSRTSLVCLEDVEQLVKIKESLR